jgi:hypothetical protein
MKSILIAKIINNFLITKYTFTSQVLRPHLRGGVYYPYRIPPPPLGGKMAKRGGNPLKKVYTKFSRKLTPHLY